jgi:hypothetical protein
MRALPLMTLVAVAGCGSVESDPCGSDALCIGLHLAGTATLDQLEVSLENVPVAPQRSPMKPKAFTLPVKLALHLPAGSTGPVVVAVRGLFGGVERVHGRGMVTLDERGPRELTVALDPGTFDMGSPPPEDLGCNLCGARACGTTLELSRTVDSWSGNLDAKAGADVSVINDNMQNRGGSLIFARPLVIDEFKATFDFRFSWNADMGKHGDGMAFVLIKEVPDGDKALGGLGGGLGMIGMRVADGGAPLSGYGVELDTYANDVAGESADCQEVASVAEHVNIDTLDTCTVNMVTLPAPLGRATHVPLADGKWHRAVVTLEKGEMTVSITALDPSADATPVVVQAALRGFTPGETYYVGFTGATGIASEAHELTNVAITFPSPRCL